MRSARHQLTLRTVVFWTTALRIICAAAIVTCVALGHWLPLLPLALVAFASDYLDGWLARRWQVVSGFGMAFDPLADKVICLTLLAVAAAHISAWYWLLFVIFAIYDTFTMTTRFMLSTPMPASKTAKLKTALLMIGLIAMILSIYAVITAWIAVVLLIGAAVLTARSLVGYTRAIGRSLDWLEFAPGVAAIDFAAWHKKYGVRAMLFDIEGTLTPWRDPQVDSEVSVALKQAQKSGIAHLGLVSNMHPRHSARAAAVADQIDASTYHVTAIPSERKPSPTMVRAALAKLDVPAKEAGFAGDKLVDVLAARRAGIKRVAWVERLGTVDHPFDRLVYRPIEQIVKWAIR